VTVGAGAISFALFLGLSVSGCDRETGAAPQALAAPKPVAPKPAAPTSCSPALFASAGDVRDGRVVLVLFWAAWSAPDKLMIAAVESEIARDADRWRLIKSDIDKEPKPAQACDIRSIPTLIAFAKGKPASQVVGAVPRARVRQLLEAASAANR
jgi:thiol-disulfide isomerase/thioredoxin